MHRRRPTCFPARRTISAFSPARSTSQRHSLDRVARGRAGLGCPAKNRLAADRYPGDPSSRRSHRRHRRAESGAQMPRGGAARRGTTDHACRRKSRRGRCREEWWARWPRHRHARPHRQSHLLPPNTAVRLAFVGGHPVLDQLQPRSSRARRSSSAAIRCSSCAACLTTRNSFAATNIPTPTSALPRPSSPTTRRWRRAPMRSSGYSLPARPPSRRRSAPRRRIIRSCAPTYPRSRGLSVSPAAQPGRCSRKSASAKIDSRA